jgi:hypothetical protein
MSTPLMDEHDIEEFSMYSPRKTASLFVDRAYQQWILLDRDGNFWKVVADEASKNEREPFHPTEETQLEPVPGHYIHMLGLDN